jgi:hypothetical protein
MFRDAADSASCLLPVDPSTVEGLLKLGEAMADPGTQADPQSQFDSKNPAVLTYLGQFIDHDLTARTDREAADGGLSISQDGDTKPGLAPMAPGHVVDKVFNARRPQFDLDSLYGDGPSLVDANSPIDFVTTAADQFYEDLRFKVEYESNGYLDLPRYAAGESAEHAAGAAKISDERNDENLNISQLDTSKYRLILVFGGWGRLARALAVPSVH